MQRDAVHDGAHAELAYAVVDVVAPGIHAHGLAAAPVGQVRTGQVGRAAQQLAQDRGVGFKRVLAGLAGGDGLGLEFALLDELVDGLFEAGGQFAAHAALELFGFGGVAVGICIEQRVPGLFERLALSLGIPGVVHGLRDFERGVRPSQRFARSGDFNAAQRGAMHVVAAFLVGRTLADERAAADQGRLVGLLGLGNGGVHGVNVVAVHGADHVPAVGFEALRGVVVEPVDDVAIDRDAVVVPQRDQLVQLERAGQRAGFVADAFHQAAVAQEDIGVMVDDVKARAIEFLTQQTFSQGHADGVGDALAERAGGGFHARGDAVFRVAGGLAVQLAEILQFRHRQVVAGEVQQRVDQHRAVAVGQHETVTIRPARVQRVVAQVAAPQCHGNIRHAHRRARVARIGLLDGVHGEHANGVGHQLGRLGGVRVEGGGGHANLRQEIGGKTAILPDGDDPAGVIAVSKTCYDVPSPARLTTPPRNRRRGATRGCANRGLPCCVR